MPNLPQKRFGFPKKPEDVAFIAWEKTVEIIYSKKDIRINFSPQIQSKPINIVFVLCCFELIK